MGFLPTDFFQKREKSWAMISFQGWEALFIKYAIYKKTWENLHQAAIVRYISKAYFTEM